MLQLCIENWLFLIGTALEFIYLSITTVSTQLHQFNMKHETFTDYDLTIGTFPLLVPTIPSLTFSTTTKLANSWYLCFQAPPSFFCSIFHAGQADKQF